MSTGKVSHRSCQDMSRNRVRGHARLKRGYTRGGNVLADHGVEHCRLGRYILNKSECVCSCRDDNRLLAIASASDKTDTERDEDGTPKDGSKHMSSFGMGNLESRNGTQEMKEHRLM